MSAALQLPTLWGEGLPAPQWFAVLPEPRSEVECAAIEPGKPEARRGIEFYRKHTEKLLRRYLYASMQVGRAPSLLGEPVARGWASCSVVRTFEDAVIFVLDVETCLNELDTLDRMLLSRIVLQAYTQDEAAALLGISNRTVNRRYQEALDRLTEKLLESEILVLR